MGRLLMTHRSARVRYWTIAVAVLAMVGLTAGCTRSDGYVVFYNGCDEDIVIVGIEGHDPDVVPAGGAKNYMSKDRPDVTLELPGGRAVPVDFHAWVDKYSDAPDGDVVVEQSVCDGLGGAPVFTNQTSRYLDEAYGDLLSP